MNLKFKRAVDTWAGLPALLLLTVVTRALGAVLHRNHDRDPVDSILIMKFQGIGSLVMAKPAVAHLRRFHPDARFVFWGCPGTAELARLCPEFDEVLVLDDRSPLRACRTLLKSLVRIWSMRIDWLFDLEVYSKLSSILATLTCARNRAGFAVLGVQQRRSVHTHLVLFNRYVYLGEAYASLLGLLGGAERCDPDHFGEWSLGEGSPTARRHGEIMVHMYAGELAPERQWPHARFQELIERLLQSGDMALRIVLIGHGDAEEAQARKLPAHDRIENLVGKLSLDDLLRRISGCELLIANDSAPLHLAVSLGTPVIGLFGPTRAASYFPVRRKNALALSEELYCSPCVHHWDPAPCRGDNQCMKRIAVDRVLGTVHALRSGRGGEISDAPGGIGDPSYYPGLIYRRMPEKTSDA